MQPDNTSPHTLESYHLYDTPPNKQLIFAPFPPTNTSTIDKKMLTLAMVYANIEPYLQVDIGAMPPSLS